MKSLNTYLDSSIYHVRMCVKSVCALVCMYVCVLMYMCMYMCECVRACVCVCCELDELTKLWLKDL